MCNNNKDKTSIPSTLSLSNLLKVEGLKCVNWFRQNEVEIGIVVNN